MSAKMTSTDDSVQIVLIGATGSGKSSSGNTILGSKRFRAETSAKSITVKCQSVTEMINGRQVTVVDTPGWDCTELSGDEVAGRIKQHLKKLHGPYAFLLVIPVGSVEHEEISKIYNLEGILGSSYLQHTTILFSHSDNLEDKTFDEFLKEGGEDFQTLLKRCSHRCHTWNNRNERSDEDVDKVLQDLKKTEMKNQDLVKNTQKEMHSNLAENPSGSSILNVKDSVAGERVLKGVKVARREYKECIQVLFLGMTKVGKTASIKTLLQKCENVETEDQVNRCSASGLNLRLVECPGFDDNEREIMEAISTSLSFFCPGPHVIIIVMSVERFTQASKSIMNRVYDGLGQDARNHTLVLFTRKNNLVGKPIAKFIEENADLRQLVEMYGNRFLALENRDTSDQTQVDELLEIIADIYDKNETQVYQKDKRNQSSKNKKDKQSKQDRAAKES